MKFKDIKLNKNYFVLLLETDVWISFPFNKIETMMKYPTEKKLVIEVKKFGPYERVYETFYLLDQDFQSLMVREKK
ncbi:hypothetical protein LCGC14_1290530 [marine sediment metagenome]|uniref:Uncharacterized protein n=1 Tax=marine sediment metagenome TaxID=412755 RepID=A0A0F9NVJ4_9ZZZZ